MKTVCKTMLPDFFNLRQTLDCGQCFRFSECGENRFCGVMLGSYVEMSVSNGVMTVYSDGKITSAQVFSFLDLDEDYARINKILEKDETLCKAIKYAGGIRILRQPPWEALCSFILSQNNNIKRITGIISRLCENFGDDLGGGNYSFPEPARLAGLCERDLDVLRSGFRAKYVLDAAEKVCSGDVNFNFITHAETAQAREMLMKINGVGPKVADCTLLFGFHKLDAFPVDVWIKKVMSAYYPQGLPEFAKAYGGIAQQYLFHYMRTSQLTNKD